MTFKIALFTNQYPAKVNTFFSRDVYSLIRNGFDVDIFPVYPIEKDYWRFVPSGYRELIQTNTRIIHVSPFRIQKRNNRISKECNEILYQSLQYGLMQFLKSYYVINQSKRWFGIFGGEYDYFLAYWGNYSATYAFLSNHASPDKKPFSIFLHAGTDLYRDQIFLEQKLLSAHKIFTVCDFNIKYLEKLYPRTFVELEKKLVLYHLGIDLKELEFIHKGRKDSCLLAVGSLFPSKGFSDILQALAILKPRLPNIKLIIIGEGPEKANLVKRAKELAISSQVTLTGHLPFEEVKKYMQKCTLLIHPSSELGDAVPTVIKEALACGLPVVASDIAGIPELLSYGKAGVLVKPKDFVTLANSIQMLLQNHELRRMLAETGRNLAEQMFDMHKNGEELSRQLKIDLP